ncbi:protein FAM168A isoform X1 [Passer montanus]|uniref:protein FAM168A isoform X1 n=1 Tax=Passer montanus TaxID=9160 RepID=UPI00195FDD18|nr:protein FAM168A isoform X1 [Passer montanus]
MSHFSFCSSGELWNAVKTPCPSTLLSGLSPSQGSSYPREFPVFHHESCLQPRPTWGSLRKPEEHGLYRLSNRLSHCCPSLQSQHVPNQQPRLRPSHTSDEAGLAPDLLVLCHRGHLPPPGGRWHREQNLPGFFCSFQVHRGDSLQGATDPEQQRPSSLLAVSEPVPNRDVPHQKCLPTAEPVHPGSLLHPARVRGPAPRHPPHHGGAAQQHPLCHLPGPGGRAPHQRRGHGHGGWHHHGNVSRNLVDHPPTHRHRSTSSVRANVQGSRNPHLQLRTSTLVNHWPTISGVKHCMQLHKSYIGAAAAGLQRLVCLQEQKKKKKSARVTLCIL